MQAARLVDQREHGLRDSLEDQSITAADSEVNKTEGEGDGGQYQVGHASILHEASFELGFQGFSLGFQVSGKLKINPWIKHATLYSPLPWDPFLRRFRCER